MAEKKKEEVLFVALSDPVTLSESDNFKRTATVGSFRGKLPVLDIRQYYKKEGEEGWNPGRGITLNLEALKRLRDDNVIDNAITTIEKNIATADKIPADQSPPKKEKPKDDIPKPKTSNNKQKSSKATRKTSGK